MNTIPITIALRAMYSRQRAFLLVASVGAWLALSNVLTPSVAAARQIEPRCNLDNAVDQTANEVTGELLGLSLGLVIPLGIIAVISLILAIFVKAVRPWAIGALVIVVLVGLVASDADSLLGAVVDDPCN